MKIKLGMSPISWSNDDLPQLGGKTPLDVCLFETRQAGYTGTETGGKFPKNSSELSSKLNQFQLSLVSGWYSGTIINNDLETEIRKISPQLELFKSVGASVIVYGETFDTVQNQPKKPLSSRPKLVSFDLKEYGRKLTELACHCLENGVPLTFHHHMGTAVENEMEIDLLMSNTGSEVGLLLDTGHLYFAGGDYKNVLQKHAKRINHVHTKDIRSEIFQKINFQNESFLDCVLKGVFTVPGDGIIDYNDFVKRLFDINYEGWMVVEAEQDPLKANPFEYAKLGYQTLIHSLNKAGYELEK